MKKKKQSKLFFMMILLVTLMCCSCGMNNNQGNSSSNTQNNSDKVDLYSPGEFGSTTSDGIEPEEYGTNTDTENPENVVNDITDRAANAVEDVAEGAINAVDDVADGIGDAIDNLGGGSFDRYEDARDYLLGKLRKDNAAANYEVRDENTDLTAYNHNDSGAEGYQFSVYETDNNEKIGIYYVDKNTGKIYRYMGKNSIEAY